MAGKRQTKTTDERLSGKRLSFLYMFLKANFITLRSIPTEVIPYAALNTNMGKDDMRLSQAIRILNHYHYNLFIYLEPKDPYNAERYRERCVHVNALKFTPTVSSNMAFLRDFVEVNKLKLKDITDKMGVAASAIYYWYQSDDLMISKIYKLAKVFNVNLRFVIEPMETVQKGNNNPAVILNINARKAIPINDEMVETIWEKRKNEN